MRNFSFRFFRYNHSLHIYESAKFFTLSSMIYESHRSSTVIQYWYCNIWQGCNSRDYIMHVVHLWKVLVGIRFITAISNMRTVVKRSKQRSWTSRYIRKDGNRYSLSILPATYWHKKVPLENCLFSRDTKLVPIKFIDGYEREPGMWPRIESGILSGL